jgi:hypothetical protein
MFSGVFVRQTISKSKDGFFVFYELSPAIYNGIAKIDFDGNIQWTNTYEWHKNIYPVPVHLDGGRTALFYGAGDFVQCDILSPQGAIIQTDTIRIHAYQLEDVQLTTSKGFLLCGSLDSGNINKMWGYPTHAFIARIDSNYQHPEIYEIPQLTLLRQFNIAGNRFIGFGEKGNDHHVFSDSLLFKPYDYTTVWEVPGGNQLESMMYPNPAADQVTIRSPFTQNYSIAIYDIRGVLMYKLENVRDAEQQISVADFSPGMYMVINNDDKGNTARGKMIKK